MVAACSPKRRYTPQSATAFQEPEHDNFIQPNFHLLVLFSF
jgi:hypothetical protein